jgi:hypothetical protein
MSVWPTQAASLPIFLHPSFQFYRCAWGMGLPKCLLGCSGSAVPYKRKKEDILLNSLEKNFSQYSEDYVWQMVLSPNHFTTVVL